MKDRRTARSGQAILEACFVIIVVALLFFALLQVSQLFTAKAVLTYAASAGARAKSVGFNDFMVSKVVRVAAIPTAGELVNPTVARGGGASFWGRARPGHAWNAALHAGTPYSPQYAIERSRIPLYLGTRWWSETDAVLEYARWPDLRWNESYAGDFLVRIRTGQKIPLVFPFARAFYAGDSVDIQSGDPDDRHYVTREAHARLYLE